MKKSKEDIEQNKELYLEYQEKFLSLPKSQIRNKLFWLWMYPIAMEFFTNLTKKKLKLKHPTETEIYEYAMDCILLLLDRYNRIPNWRVDDLTAMGYWIWVGACQNKKRAFEERLINLGDRLYDSMDTLD